MHKSGCVKECPVGYFLSVNSVDLPNDGDIDSGLKSRRASLAPTADRNQRAVRASLIGRYQRATVASNIRRTRAVTPVNDKKSVAREVPACHKCHYTCKRCSGEGLHECSLCWPDASYHAHDLVSLEVSAS